MITSLTASSTDTILGERWHLSSFPKDLCLEIPHHVPWLKVADTDSGWLFQKGEFIGRILGSHAEDTKLGDRTWQWKAAEGSLEEKKWRSRRKELPYSWSSRCHHERPLAVLSVHTPLAQISESREGISVEQSFGHTHLLVVLKGGRGMVWTFKVSLLDA